MATQAFDKLSIDAIAVAIKIRERQWIAVAELAGNLARDVGKVRGAWVHLLDPIESDKFESAGINFLQFIDSMPMVTPEVEFREEDVQWMLVQCHSLIAITSEVAGRLGVESIQEAEEK